MVTCDFLLKSFILLLAIITFVEMTEGVRMPMQISKDVAKIICHHRSRFVKLGELEEPVIQRYRPISPSRCGWYSFGDCDNGGRCSYQDYEDCSVQVRKKKNFHNRIHGGIEVVPHSHPSMVLVLTADYICGAVIVATDWLLTAAHCTSGIYEQDMRLLAGRHNMNNAQSEMSTQQLIMEVKKIHEHPKFNPDPNVSSSDDICLLELYDDTKFKFNNYVNYADIASASYVATGKATLIGWGERQDSSILGPLHQVEMKIVSDSECSKYYPTFRKEQICTYEKRRSGCRGDSGSPLFQFVGGDPIVIGIYKADGNCSFSIKPSVSTEVSHYTEWIWKIRDQAAVKQSHLKEITLG